IEGVGPTERLATALRKALDAVQHVRRTPALAESFGGPDIPATSSIDPKPLEAILGRRGQAKDGMAKFVFERKTTMHGMDLGAAMGVSTWAAFAGNPERAVVDGDFAMLESDVQIVLKALRAAHIHVVAPALRANLGLVRELEGVAEFEAAHAVSSSARSRSEVRNAALSLKAILREGALQGVAGPSLALEASLLLPTAHGERQPGSEVVAIASTGVHGWTLHANGGPLLDTVRANPGLAWGVIVESPLVRDVRAVAEL